MDPSAVQPTARRNFLVRAALGVALGVCLAVPLAVHAAPQVAVGDVLSGRYRLDRELGEGGMATVFAATELRRGRQVAIKWLSHPAGGGAYASMRLMQEYQALARLDHPNIVHVDRVARHRGRYYLVMELLQGETLGRVMDAGPMPAERAIGLMLPVLDALSAAHAHGVIHRDLKPDNIFISRDARGRNVVKVIDFGLSKLVAGEDEYDAKLTKHGGTLGTPSYMAPEQIRSAERVDARADIYALGVVLYEMLSGRLPHETTGYNDTIIEVVTGTPKPLATLQPGLPARLCAIVMKAMAKNPDHRFQTVRALRSALASYAEREVAQPATVAALVPTTEPRREREPTRLGLLDAAGMGAAGLLIMASAFAGLRRRFG